MSYEDMIRNLGIAMSQLSATRGGLMADTKERIDSAQHAIRVVCDELVRRERDQPSLFG